MPSPKHPIPRVVQGLSSISFPQHCYHCQIPLAEQTEVLCRECETELPFTNFENQTDNIVFQTFWGRAPISFATAGFHFRHGETLQKLMHLLKYRNHPEIGIYLGRLMGQQLAKSNLITNLTSIIPVPLHARRLTNRGYNQSDMIAQGIAEALNLEVMSDLLFRTSYNTSQTTKKHYERWQNVDGIFHVEAAHRAQNGHLLLIDDIITTGSTLEACCRALTKINNVKITVAVVGYTNL